MVPSVAVVGATGAVGEIMRQVLEEHGFPLRSIKFLASERSAGKAIEFKGKRYPVEPLALAHSAGVPDASTTAQETYATFGEPTPGPAPAMFAGDASAEAAPPRP